MEKTASALSRKEYLKKYVDNIEDDKKKKKKSKKKTNKPQSHSMGGVLVVDQDPVWQKPVIIKEENEEDDSADEQPQINEDIEVKRMKRMEQVRARRPYHAISEEGSGWVVVADNQSNANGGNRSPLPESERNILNSTNSDRDLSPIRASHSPDLSPPRRNRPLSQSVAPEDISPPRRNRPNLSGDISPPRRNRPNSQLADDSDNDISPPRRNRPNLSEDISPPRRNRPNFSEDISPPRRNRPHPQKGEDSGEEISPRRSRFDSQRVDSVEDMSPPRRRGPQSQRNDVAVRDLSPPRKRKELGMSKSSDLSPPRKIPRSPASPDLSPPRKNKANSKEEARTGLLTAQEIKKEIERKKKEELKKYKELDPAMTGRGAEPVYRDKAGNRLTKDEMLKLRKGEEKPPEKKLEWGKGLAQKREAEARERELELERERPFARTSDDPDLDKMLKDRLRWGDPMAHLVKSKQSDIILEDLGDDEKMKESGFIIPQKVPNHSWIIRRIDAPPNRYGIKPGRHWDGVDRSNGTEKEFFKRSSDKQATEREAYLWSVSDM